MAYFLSSLLQKHVLKYALSRLGLVDTEALDLDNLGIRWGQRSTVELRNIGLKLEVSLRDQPSLGGAGSPQILVDRGVLTSRVVQTETSEPSQPPSVL